jgi:hypothetical protein
MEMVRCRRCGAENYAIDMWCSNCSHHLDWAPPEAAAAPVAEAEPAAPVAESEPTAPVAEPVAVAASLDPQVIPVTPAAVAEAEPIVPIAEGEVAAAPSTDPDVIPVADAPAPRSRRRRPAPVWIFPVVAAALLAVVVLAAVSLGFVNVIRALRGFENHAAYWTANLALSALFWVVLLRLCWRERRQRPR